MTLKLKIIIASTRPGRGGPAVADWVAALARQAGGFEVELVDLAEIALPLLDEPAHPSLRNYQHAHTKRWSAIVDEADAFVFVTPEYNYFPPASVVNAVQYLYNEWGRKPALVVSYGGISGGLRASQMLRQLLSNVGVMPIQKVVPLPFYTKSLAEGVFAPGATSDEGATAALADLRQWAAGLRAMRAAG